jgi:hypothetical protein
VLYPLPELFVGDVSAAAADKQPAKWQCEMHTWNAQFSMYWVMVSPTILKTVFSNLKM